MKKIFRALVFSFGMMLLVALPSIALARTIYVDLANKSGEEDGSPAHPFCAVSKAYDAASAGDTIIIRAGRYSERLTLNKAITVRSERGIASIEGLGVSHHSAEAGENLFCAPFDVTVPLLGLSVTIPSDVIERLLHAWKPVECQTPVVLEGTVTEAGISDQDNPINHTTHDFTFHVVPDVVPDDKYKYLLAIGADPNSDPKGQDKRYDDIEVEWESGLAQENDDNRCHEANERGDSCGFYSAGHTRRFYIWHWPTIGDWVHVEGLWVWDRADPGPLGSKTEIHPPRLVAVQRHLPYYAVVTRPMSAGAAPLQSDRPPLGDGGPGPGDDDNPPGPTTSRVTVLVTEADVFASGDGTAIYNNRGRPFEFPDPALWPPHSPFPVHMSEKDYEFDIQQIIPRPSPTAPLGAVQQFKDPSDTFPGNPEFQYFPDGPNPHVHVKIPWRSLGAPDTALFKRAFYVYWDEGHGAPADYRPRVFQVTLDQVFVDKNLDDHTGQGAMEYRLFLEVAGRYLFANEFTSVGNILDDGLGDTDPGSTWPINQQVIVFLPPASERSPDIGFRVHSAGWEADGADDAFDRLLDPTIPEPCTWPYYNGVQDFLKDALLNGVNYLAGGRDDPIGEADLTFKNEHPPFVGIGYSISSCHPAACQCHINPKCRLEWDDGQEKYDPNDAHQVTFSVSERSLDDVLR